MKNTYEQASSDKNRVIGLFESVVREQECELEELRKISDTRGEMFDSILRMFLEKKCIDLVWVELKLQDALKNFYSFFDQNWKFYILFS